MDKMTYSFRKDLTYGEAIEKIADTAGAEDAKALVQERMSKNSALSCLNSNLFDQKKEEYRHCYYEILHFHLKQFASVFPILESEILKLPFVEQKELLEDLNQILTLDLNFEHKPQLKEKTWDWLYEIAKNEISYKSYDKAHAIFQLLIFLDPVNPTYWLCLGYVIQLQGRFEAALEAFAVSLILDPTSIDARFFSSECYIQLDDINDAKIELREMEGLLTTPELKEQWSPFVEQIQQKIFSR